MTLDDTWVITTRDTFVTGKKYIVTVLLRIPLLFITENDSNNYNDSMIINKIQFFHNL